MLPKLPIGVAEVKPGKTSEQIFKKMSTLFILFAEQNKLLLQIDEFSMNIKWIKHL